MTNQMNAIPASKITFLSTDIVNSSGMCRILGDTDYKENLYDPHWKILRECLDLHHGEFYENKGDGLLATFSDVNDAVACAVEMQQRLNNPLIEFKQQRIAVRIGIHCSETALTPDSDGKYRTGELNYVCRIESIANGSQILLSENSVLLLTNRNEFSWLEWHNRRIKSFDDSPVTVFELLWNGQSRGTPGSSWAPDWFVGDVSEYVARFELEKSIIDAFGRKSSKPYRMVTLHGSGGTGKTRLALTTAVKMAGLFEGRVHFVTFHQKPGETTDCGALLLQELRTTLGCEDSKQETVLIALTQRGNALYLIDNYESIADPSAQEVLVTILQRVKDAHLLITGQKKVELPDSEYVIELEEGMTSSEGIELFFKRARNVYHDWQPTDEELELVKHLVQLVEYVPIRIEFATAWLRKRDLKTIVNDLVISPLGKYSALPSGSRLAATTRTHHQSSELCLQYTSSMLSDTLRFNFYRLGLFGGSFSTEVIEQACGVEDAEELIDALIDASLIYRFGNPREYRYTMHRLTSSYCNRKLREIDNWKDIAGNFIQYYAAHSKDFCEEEVLKIPDRYLTIQNEWLNLKSASILGIELNSLEDTVSLARNLYVFIGKSELFSEGVELYEMFLKWYDRIENQDLSVIALLLDHYIDALCAIGNFPAAIGHLNRLFDLVKSQNGVDSIEYLNIVDKMIAVTTELGNFESQMKFIMIAKELIEKRFGKEHYRYADILCSLGSICNNTGKYADAEVHLLDAKNIAEQCPDPSGRSLANILLCLGMLYDCTGRFLEAIPIFEKAVALSDQMEVKRINFLGTALSQLGNSYHRTNRSEDAVKCGERALSMLEQQFHGDHPNLVSILNNLSGGYEGVGRIEEGEQCLKRALAINIRFFGRNHKFTPVITNNLGYNLLRHHNVEEALATFQDALNLMTEIYGPDFSGLAIAMNGIGISLFHQGKFLEAETTFKKAVEHHERTVGRIHPFTANMFTGWGRACHSLKRFSEAERHFQAALEIREQIFGKDDQSIISSCCELAEILIPQGNANEARALFERALQIVESKMGRDHPEAMRIKEQIDRLN